MVRQRAKAFSSNTVLLFVFFVVVVFVSVHPQMLSSLSHFRLDSSATFP